MIAVTAIDEAIIDDEIIYEVDETSTLAIYTLDKSFIEPELTNTFACISILNDDGSKLDNSVFNYDMNSYLFTIGT